MKKIIIILAILNLNLICMAQTKLPEALFEQQNINVFLGQEEHEKIYLTQVAVYMPVNVEEIFWGSEMDEDEFQEREIEFSMVFHYNLEHELSQLKMASVAYFSKDTVDYKIYQTTFLNNWIWRESENHAWQPMSFQAARGKCIYIGNSDNDELLPVKVWNYVQQNWKRAN